LLACSPDVKQIFLNSGEGHILAIYYGTVRWGRRKGRKETSRGGGLSLGTQIFFFPAVTNLNITTVETVLCNL